MKKDLSFLDARVLAPACLVCLLPWLWNLWVDPWYLHHQPGAGLVQDFFLDGDAVDYFAILISLLFSPFVFLGSIVSLILGLVTKGQEKGKALLWGCLNLALLAVPLWHGWVRPYFITPHR